MKNASKQLAQLATSALLLLSLIAQAQTTPADGTPDFQFEPNVDGIVSPELGNLIINAIALQNDGKILIGGRFNTVGIDDQMQTRNNLARLNADGTIDNDFAVLDVNEEIFAIAVQSNGDILFAGDFSMVDTTTRNGIARVDTNGNLDMEFDPNATGISTDFEVANVRAVTLQANGQILIGGLFTQVGGVDQSFLARLNPDGNLDDSFTTTVDNTQGAISINAIALTPNNQIVFTGIGFASVNGLPLSNVVRLNSNGDVDTTFNSPDVAISDIFWWRRELISFTSRWQDANRRAFSYREQ